MNSTLNTRKYADPAYSGFETAPEILQAIETAYASSILDRDRLTAYGAWEYPSDFERAAIIDWAFELADPEENRLAWGASYVTRPTEEAK
jgi:hypothetical protein